MVHDGLYSESMRIQLSQGWAEKFISRNGLVNCKVYGERDSVNKEEVQESLDIFNCDETGLDWRTLYKNGYVVGEGKRIKVSKERITDFVGCNFTGTMKLPLFINGKSKKPNGFKNEVQTMYRDNHILFYRNNPVG